MGRHRRNAAGRAASVRAITGRAVATDAHSPRAAGAWEAPPVRPRRGAHRHRGRGFSVVRTGLLGATAAVALGVVAVTAGVLPGGGSHSVGGDSGSDEVRSAGAPTGLETQGGIDGPASGATPSHPDPDRSSGTAAAKSSASGPRSSHHPAAETAKQDRHKPPKRAGSGPTAAKATATEGALVAAKATATKAPSHSSARAGSTAEPGSTAPSATGSAGSAAAAQVLTLVNQERSKAGCSPLRSDGALAHLAGAFSKQMADEGFFDHTDPVGLSPWDRAAKAGITDLGGENIARGQADAKAVMEAWMNSPGHRANILNCDYKTIGIGVHFGTGGPWWTQDFGF